MAQVLLLSVAPESGGPYNRGAFRKLIESARLDRFRKHSLTDDPSAADLILFAELYGAGAYFQSVPRHPFVDRFGEKCFLFCSNDFIIPFLPGIYASIERRWSSRRTRSGFYLAVSENEFVEFTPPGDEMPYLYSFLGTVNTAPVRRQLASLSHRRSFFRTLPLRIAKCRAANWISPVCSDTGGVTPRYSSKANSFFVQED